MLVNPKSHGMHYTIDKENSHGCTTYFDWDKDSIITHRV
jgi:hypothetical protein